jgi:membrane protease YdiL (CAAX protease family)
LLAVVAIGGTLLYGVAIVLVLAAIGINPSHVQKSTTESGMVAVVAQILADLSVMAYLAVQARVRFRALFWNLLGWRKLETGGLPRGLVYGGFILGGFFLAILVTLLDSAFPTKQPLPIQALLDDHRTAILFMLTAVLVAPLVEETIFRGYIYPVCVRSFGMGWGILATGTMFGLLHSVQLWGGWWQIGFLILVGIVLTAARAATGTVVASFLVHVSYNALPVIAYVVATHGFRQAPPLH